MTRRAAGATTRDGYGYQHQRARAAILADHPPCWRGCGRTATHADHVPPLAQAAATLGLTRAHAGELYTIDGTGPLQLLPSCAPCNLAGALVPHRPPPPPPRPDLGSSQTW